MLKNYDAEAVAEVMGIGFWDDPGKHPVIAARAAKAGRPSKTTAGTHGKIFVIDVNHAPLRIVDIRAGRADKRGSGSQEHPGVPNLAMRPASPVLIEKAVEQGLPRVVLRHVAEQIAGADKTKIAALEWGIVPKTTLERREAQLSPLESERTERVARLFVHARRALGSEAEAREFITAPHPQLDGRTPIDAAMTDLGARRAEQILNALEYGLAL